MERVQNLKVGHDQAILGFCYPHAHAKINQCTKFEESSLIILSETTKDLKLELEWVRPFKFIGTMWPGRCLPLYQVTF